MPGAIIGTGGFGTVTRGKLHGQNVAVKRIVLPDKVYIPQNVASVLQAATGMSQEALDMKEMSHPNILPIKGYWFQQTEDKRYLCIATELMQHNLAEFIKLHPAYDPHVMQKIALEVCSALSYIADKDKAHLDVKPANILISMHGYFITSKLGDFGLSGRTGGTPLYCSPEQLVEAKVGKSDVFGFGVTLLRMVTRYIPNILLCLPLTEATLRNAIFQKLNSLPILEAISKMVQVDPDQRPDFKIIESILRNEFPSTDITKRELQACIAELTDHFFANSSIADVISQFQW